MSGIGSLKHLSSSLKATQTFSLSSWWWVKSMVVSPVTRIGFVRWKGVWRVVFKPCGGWRMGEKRSCCCWKKVAQKLQPSWSKTHALRPQLPTQNESVDNTLLTLFTIYVRLLFQRTHCVRVICVPCWVYKETRQSVQNFASTKKSAYQKCGSLTKITKMSV